MNARILLLSSAALLVAGPAFAIDRAACSLQSTSYLDALMNPVKGGDEAFFSTPSGPPNVSIVIDNSGSMTEWPIDFTTCPSGCGCKQLDDLNYDPNTQYEPEWNNYNSTGGRFDEWFNKNKVYPVSAGVSWSATLGNLDTNKWPRDYGFGGTSGLNSAGPNPTVQSSLAPFTVWSGADRTAAIDAACSSSDTNLSRRVSDTATCKVCLATKGYYLENTSALPQVAGVGPTSLNTSYRDADFLRLRMVGNFLNFFSPRYIMARRVLKEVINDIAKVRMDLLTFGPSGSDVPTELRDFNPACNQSDPTTNSSNFDSNRNVIANELDKLQYDRSNTPLARTLFGAGYGFTNQGGGTNPYADKFGGGWAGSLNIDANGVKEQGTNNQKAVCVACAFSAIILVTDGEPNDTQEDSIPDIGDPANELVWGDCPNCANSDLDEVAKYLWTNDMRSDYPRSQRVATYTVAFGLGSGSWGQTLLRHTAEVGGGQFFSAYSSTQLKTALLSIFDNVNTRNTAFSSATVSSLQTGTANLTAVMPRMSPQRDKPWKGSLYRFALWNEFVRDQDHPGDADTDKNSIYIVDTSDSIVVEDADGQFIRDGTNTPATPVWEAGAKLRTLGYNNRRIYTVTDSNDDGVLNNSDTVIEFTTANVATLIDYLGVKGAPVCPTSLTDPALRGTLFTKLNLTITGAAAAISVAAPLSTSTTLQADLNTLCAKVLIQYIRGQDLGDENSDNDRTDVRASIFGDIFHSSPTLVTPPVERFLCDLGLSNQCVRTLYGNQKGTAPTPLASYANQSADACGTGTVTRDAYDKWQFDNRKRDRIIVVGANDGMLHAFHDGDAQTPTCPNGKEVIDYGNSSSGDEQWAFIPPDLLPRLKEHPFGHTFYVDGDTMVRDIWADANNDGQKQNNEFHTIAIGAEGRGGVHYFGLDLKFDASGNAMAPDFRWIFPQPESREATTMGKTLFSLSPKPPPVGPVLLSADASQGGVSVTSPQTRYNSPTVERWVAMLSGGWSPGREKGRGVYMVDVWNGDLSSFTGRNDNLLWKWEFDPGASGGQEVSKKQMTSSIAAPVAMVDYGGTVGGVDNVTLDGFFDTGVVGDLGGQLWVFRFFEPGRHTGSSGLISNWSGARGFEMDRDGATASSTDESGTAEVARSIRNKWPFFYLPSIGIQPETNALRAFIGSGNRYSLLDGGIGKCRFDNPLACAKSNCDDVKIEYRINRLDWNVTKDEEHWKDLTFAHAKLESSNDSKTACGTVGSDAVVAQFAEHTVNTCDNGSPGNIRQTRVTCGLRAADEFLCTKDPSRPAENYGDLAVFPSNTTLASLGRNRYFGVWLYGGIANRKFSESQTTTNAIDSAASYDDRRLTDRGASANLTDVTATTCPTDGGTCTGNMAPERVSGFADGGVSPANGLGWVYEYADIDNKTASGSSILASCVLWNDIAPGVSTGACDPNGLPVGRLYQGDFITGAPNCAAGFKNADAGTYDRSRARTVIAPPPEPAMAVQVNARGEVRYSTLLIEPGQGDGITDINVSQSNERLQLVYELPLTQALHDCRHTDGGCVTPAP